MGEGNETREGGGIAAQHPFSPPSALFLFPIGPSESSGAQEQQPQGVHTGGCLTARETQSELAASTIHATNKPYRGL